MKRGVRALFELAGRTPEHVARTLKKHTGKTPTDLVNEARMAYASGQLQTTTREILDIAMESGFSSLSHFYALFRRTFGLSPHRYRLARFKAPIHPPLRYQSNSGPNAPNAHTVSAGCTRSPAGALPGVSARASRTVASWMARPAAGSRLESAVSTVS